MGDVVNLRRERKQRTRAEKEGRAAANRAKFGRTKTERDVNDKRGQLEERRHEGHRMVPAGPQADVVKDEDGKT